ncbi:RteC domain-containing protein [Chitinophaga sp. XS-30]|uniref:RteC domain-containing protein n=1 Tax=Chitinophaga sp. XS-30 TaxID=2604421 RepID=UPI0011DD555D|nr:RteC domain-containing protein [Chitinophaga sp. XS-30]QEH39440.1 hypothetical protein FW415_00555 [Chitinophaga sp. XS-30]
MSQSPSALIAELIKEIEKLTLKELHSFKRIAGCLEEVQRAISLLKAYQDAHPFSTDKEAIYFYKTVKPELDYRLIYYHRLLRIEQACPVTGREHIRAYYRQEQQKIHAFYVSHAEFVRYYRLEATHLDAYYFMPVAGPLPGAAADEFLLYGDAYNAPMSHTLACIKAYDQLQQDLEHKIWWLDHEMEANPQQTLPETNLRFTGKKVDFAEQILAWYASGVINNGSISLRELADHCCAFFGVRYSNIHKVFEEIGQRKKARSAFCQTMQLNLERYLDMKD